MGEVFTINSSKVHGPGPLRPSDVVKRFRNRNSLVIPHSGSTLYPFFMSFVYDLTTFQKLVFFSFFLHCVVSSYISTGFFFLRWHNSTVLRPVTYQYRPDLSVPSPYILYSTPVRLRWPSEICTLTIQF